MNLEPELLASSLIAFAAIVLSGIFILATTIAFAIIGWKAKLPEPIKMGFAAACSPGLLAFVAFVVFVLTAQVELSILTQKLFELDIIP